MPIRWARNFCFRKSECENIDASDSVSKGERKGSLARSRSSKVSLDQRNYVYRFAFEYIEGKMQKQKQKHNGIKNKATEK